MSPHVCLIGAFAMFLLAAGKVSGLSWRDAGFALVVLAFLL